MAAGILAKVRTRTEMAWVLLAVGVVLALAWAALRSGSSRRPGALDAPAGRFERGLQDEALVEIEPSALRAQAGTTTPPPGVTGAQDATRPASIAGRVLDPRGNPVPAAWVGLRPNRTDQPRTESDTQGRFELEPIGEAAPTLIARADGFGPGELALELAPGERRTGVELVLSDLGALHGVLQLPHGEMAEAGFVRLDSTGSLGTHRPYAMADLPPAEFRFEALPSGWYHVEAFTSLGMEGSGTQRLATAWAQVRAGETSEVRLGAPFVTRLEVLVVQHGAPAPGLEVIVGGPGQLWGRRRATTDAGGRAEFELFAQPAVDIRVEGVVRRVVFGEQPQVSVTIERGSALVTGRVLGPAGEPIPDGARGLRLTLAALPLPGRATAYVGGPPGIDIRLDQEGRFEVEGLPPGDYLLVVDTRRFVDLEELIAERQLPFDQPLAERTVTEVAALRAGERRTVDVRLPAGRRLSVRVVPPQGRRIDGVDLTAIDGSGAILLRRTLAARQTTVLERVPARQLWLLATTSVAVALVPLEASHPPRETVVLELVPAASLTVDAPPHATQLSLVGPAGVDLVPALAPRWGWRPEPVQLAPLPPGQVHLQARTPDGVVVRRQFVLAPGSTQRVDLTAGSGH